jgi:PKD repeat protein
MRILSGKKYLLLKEVTYQFTGSTSWDSHGAAIRSYEWDFGDGTRSSRPDPFKRYNQNGSYTVTLTIRAGNRSSRESMLLEVQDMVFDYASRQPHELDLTGFDNGSRLYIDRDDRAAAVPDEVKGTALLRTSALLEAQRGSVLFSWDVTQLPCESITFRVPVETAVFLAMDETYRDKPAPNLYEYYGLTDPLNRQNSTYWPMWIAGDGWERTEWEVLNESTGRKHRLYRKAYKPGDTVRLGPNRLNKSMVGDWDREMYFVLLRTETREWFNKAFLPKT